MKLRIENLCFSYAGGGGVQDLSLQVETGEFVGLIGPNGSGKSTALKNLYRALTPDSGRVELDGEDLLRLSPRAAAQRMAVVCQENQLPFDFTVEEIVAMGRCAPQAAAGRGYAGGSPHRARGPGGREPGLLARRSFLHLSGGEKQRVLLARAIAQQCDFLVLDEPTNHLDIGYQLQIFDWIPPPQGQRSGRRPRPEPGRAVLRPAVCTAGGAVGGVGHAGTGAHARAHPQRVRCGKPCGT